MCRKQSSRSTRRTTPVSPWRQPYLLAAREWIPPICLTQLPVCLTQLPVCLTQLPGFRWSSAARESVIAGATGGFLRVVPTATDVES